MGLAGVGLPSGLVTFLFTDIEGSTRLLAGLGDRYADLLDLHHAVLREVWADHGGHEVNTEGDAFFVAFGSADDAVAACVAGQRALAREAWPDDTPLRVRMGIHTGYATPRRDDYTALAANQASRVVGAAHGGQILMSGDVVASMRRDPPATLVSRGRFRVRDFPAPLELFAVEATGWLDPGRPPRVRPADGHNLVPPLTPLVDRVEDRAWLDDTVAPGVVTTLTGTGGGGKTRLAVEFGLDVADQWRDGVWFVDLSLVASPDHVAEAVAEAVSAVATPGRPVIEDIREHLLDREVLLIVDNCEHVVAAAARVVHDLLASCTGLGVLATSRIPLGLAPERVRSLAPLAYDHDHAPAVELFVVTARDLDPEQRPVVRELCALLDGIPLALELAAARARTLPLDDILARITTDPAVVRTSDPTRPDRHRSIERVLDWSWELLPDDARTALRRVSVLSGTFSMATAVVAVSDDHLAGDDVAELVWTLLDHSLLVADLAGGSSRYRVLSPVRGYALGRSDGAERERVVRSVGRHFDATVGPTVVGSRSWVSAMAADLDNVRGVVDGLAGIDDDLGMALAWSIGRYHDLVNAYATGVAEIAAVLDRHPSETPSRVGLLCLQAYIHLRMGEIEAAEPLLQSATELAGRVGAPPWDEACVLRTQGEVALRRGELSRAVAIGQAALRDATSDRSATRCWNLLGLALAQRGELRQAHGAFENELATAERVGLEISLAKTRGNVAEMALQLGDRARAAHHQLSCLDLARSNGEPVLVAYSVMVAARLLADEGDHRQALVLHEAALGALDGSGHTLYPGDVEVAEAFRTELRSALGAETYGTAIVAGAGLDLAQAATLAEEVLQRVSNEQEL